MSSKRDSEHEKRKLVLALSALAILIAITVMAALFKPPQQNNYAWPYKNAERPPASTASVVKPFSVEKIRELQKSVAEAQNNCLVDNMNDAIRESAQYGEDYARIYSLDGFTGSYRIPSPYGCDIWHEEGFYLTPERLFDFFAEHYQSIGFNVSKQAKYVEISWTYNNTGNRQPAAASTPGLLPSISVEEVHALYLEGYKELRAYIIEEVNEFITQEAGTGEVCAPIYDMYTLCAHCDTDKPAMVFHSALYIKPKYFDMLVEHYRSIDFNAFKSDAITMKVCWGQPTYSSSAPTHTNPEPAVDYCPIGEICSPRA